MPKAHIRNGELTIPLSDEIHEKLSVHEGEQLQAHVLEDGLIVTRTSPDLVDAPDPVPSRVLNRSELPAQRRLGTTTRPPLL
jgi:hypothetical protein